MQVISTDAYNSQSEKDLNELQELYAHISESRILQTRISIPKDRKIRELLWEYPDNTFRQLVRMDKATFLKLLNSIKTHDCFSNNSHCEQVNEKFKGCMFVYIYLSLITYISAYIYTAHIYINLYIYIHTCAHLYITIL